MNGPYTIDSVIGTRYKITTYVGQGGMQHVYGAEDLVLNRYVALKTPKNASAEKRFHRSAVVSARINHPNVAKTLDYLEDHGRAHLIEELIEGEDLQSSLIDKCEHVDPFLATRLFHYLSKGMAASHRVGVIHRDMKPTNIMISGGFNLEAVKITDFGIAKMADEELAHAAEKGNETLSASATAVGALPYMAPEAIETPREVTLAVDIWSLGAMMFEIVSGVKPFGSGLKAVRAILNCSYHPWPGFITANPQFSYLAKQLQSLILSCLQLDPDKRPTAQSLVDQCSDLCYPKDHRTTGRIKKYHHNKWGFITGLDYADVFLHRQSVYGRIPAEGERVMYSQFPGGKSDRAYPVVALKQP